jgi:RNA polymerase sigma-70 factor, ECF subfamily
MLYAMAERQGFFEAAPAKAARATTLDARAARGDRDALARLLREHGRAIQELCFFVAGHAEAADAAQEAFEKIVVGIGKFDPERGSFRTWALTVARNACRDRLRRRGLERATFSDDEVEGASGSNPEDHVANLREVANLEQALSTLPEPMRAAIVLFHLQEASYEEIADTLEVPKGTVMTWLHRGRKRLQAALAVRAGAEAGA